MLVFCAPDVSLFNILSLSFLFLEGSALDFKDSTGSLFLDIFLSIFVVSFFMQHRAFKIH